MKRENFEKARKLLNELGEINTSIESIKSKGANSYLCKIEAFVSSSTSLYANETTFNVLLQHYKLEKERIEKELEEL